MVTTERKPPAYTEFIGFQLMQTLQRGAEDGKR